MIPYGTLLNVLLVILGGTIGFFTKKIISSHLQKKIFFALGLFTIIIGLSMCFNFQNYVIVIISLILGSKFGNYFNLDLTGYQPERYYTLNYKIVSGSGTADETRTFIDEGFTFKVTL